MVQRKLTYARDGNIAGFGGFIHFLNDDCEEGHEAEKLAGKAWKRRKGIWYMLLQLRRMWLSSLLLLVERRQGTVSSEVTRTQHEISRQGE